MVSRELTAYRMAQHKVKKCKFGNAVQKLTHFDKRMKI